MRLVVTVKAFPGLSNHEGEVVCVAGVRLDTVEPEWVRLWPVGFRELEPGFQFKKWQVVDVEVTAARGDDRPESHRPNLDTLKLIGSVIPSSNGWKKRKALVGGLLGQVTLCDLIAAQGAPGSPSLGLVRVRPGATATIVDGPMWTPERELLAKAAAEPHLFREDALVALKPPAYQVRYQWHCMHPSCPGHKHSTCDWEVAGAILTFEKRYADVRPHLLEKFGGQMLGDERETYFFVGNQHRFRDKFMVLGAFYPRLES